MLICEGAHQMSYAAGRWGWEGCFIIKRRINSPSKGRAILVKPKEKLLKKSRAFLILAEKGAPRLHKSLKNKG
jgi:hypothetical protein